MFVLELANVYIQIVSLTWPVPATHAKYTAASYIREVIAIGLFIAADVVSDMFPSPLSSSLLHFANQMLEPTEQLLWPIVNSRANKLIFKVHDLMYSHTTDSLTC